MRKTNVIFKSPTSKLFPILTMLTGFSIFGHKCKFRSRIIGIDSSDELRKIEKKYSHSMKNPMDSGIQNGMPILNLEEELQIDETLKPE
jgi:hypothetical protein